MDWEAPIGSQDGLWVQTKALGSVLQVEVVVCKMGTALLPWGGGVSC